MEDEMNGAKEQTEVFSMRLSAGKAAGFRRLASTEGRDPAEHLEYLAVEAMIAAGLLPPHEVEVHRLREGLVRRFVDAAVRIYAATPRTDITAEAAKQIVAEASWLKDYERYKELREIRTINPTFGRRVKLRLNLLTGKQFAVPQPNILSYASHLLPQDDGGLHVLPAGDDS
ncbi:hypothetical protein CRT60_06600 [Azospirillum palustre]|uniref:Uncharacterized protein n=1 Tax=Azospirillum palustre TaxID=2044885 RepID=A0A2B8BKA6_9PROT|nr:hypothetical protein [Azospirillum palustre]PGH57657.1 hypothetical protein CRT60_06600 [Azospirillum palustre]